ncbi:MAG: LacI family DNA-binding transcriptional regulator [Actinobacteria bacterium]|nr:LacI family DNA-binding transcriptional regulator [Actinomycetota bacterium]
MSERHRLPQGASANGRTRLADVALASSVTKSVASRVLNQDPTLQVRPETRRRVWTAARELGYRPHAGARALAGQEARALALLIPDLNNPVYPRIIRGAYQRAREHGYVVLLAEDTADHAADESFAELVESGRVDGLLIGSARPAHPLLGSPRLSLLPHVFVTREVAGSQRNVTLDFPAASTVAVEHLYRLGHRRIGHISGPKERTPAASRERGFRAVMASLQLDGSCVEHGPFSESGGAEATQRLVSRWPDLTAIYVSTLTQALGVLHRLHQIGLRVPDDVSVITYDDLPLAGYLQPPLTTIAMPLVDLGAAAVDALVQQLGGAPPEDITIATPPTLIVRSSTARPTTMPLPQASRRT